MSETMIKLSNGTATRVLSPVQITSDWNSHTKKVIEKSVQGADLIDGVSGFSKEEEAYWVYLEGKAANVKNNIQTDQKRQIILSIYALQKIIYGLSDKDVIKTNQEMVQTLQEKVGLTNEEVVEIKITAALDYLNEKEPEAYAAISQENSLVIAEYLVNRCDDCRLKVIVKFKELFLKGGKVELGKFGRLARALHDPVINKGFDSIVEFYKNPENVEKDFPVTTSMLRN